jgi:fructose-1,6-bisphosphatase/inositol monophosphatase family enzyme
MDLVTITKSVENLLIQAGKLIEADFIAKSFTTDTKSDNSFVTSTDIRVQEYLIPELNRIAPQCTIISEELGLLEYPIGKKYVITIDPLAGTSNFVNGIPRFDIMVSIVIDGKVVWGTTYNPIEKKFNGTRESKFKPNKGLLRTLLRKDSPIRFNSNIIEIPKKSLMLGYRPIINLINGELDFVIYPNDAINIWDIAPLHGILKEQGGNLYTLSGEEYQYNELVNNEDLIALIDYKLLREVIESISITER